jgi:hypothetical protein
VAHPTAYSIGCSFLPRGYSSRGRGVYHPPPRSAKVKNEWRYTCTAIMCLHCVDKGQLDPIYIKLIFSKYILFSRLLAMIPIDPNISCSQSRQCQLGQSGDVVPIWEIATPATWCFYFRGNLSDLDTTCTACEIKSHSVVWTMDCAVDTIPFNNPIQNTDSQFITTQFSCDTI